MLRNEALRYVPQGHVEVQIRVDLQISDYNTFTPYTAFHFMAGLQIQHHLRFQMPFGTSGRALSLYALRYVPQGHVEVQIRGDFQISDYNTLQPHAAFHLWLDYKSSIIYASRCPSEHPEEPFLFTLFDMFRRVMSKFR